MEGPKKIYRMGQCWCEKPTHEDNKGYVPADLADALAEAAEKVVTSLDAMHESYNISERLDESIVLLKAALAAYRGEVNE